LALTEWDVTGKREGMIDSRQGASKTAIGGASKLAPGFIHPSELLKQITRQTALSVEPWACVTKDYLVFFNFIVLIMDE
jgi:hypothetical protein